MKIKKLELNKQSIANLSQEEMNSAKGGATECLTTCITCEPTNTIM